MPTTFDVDAILARIDHADQHAERCIALTDEYTSSDAAKVVRRLDRDASRFIYSVAEPPPFGTMSLVFGDAVHGYRAALDNLTWSAVSANSRTPTKKNMFPIIKEWTKESAKFIADPPRGMTPQQIAVISSDQPHLWDKHSDDHPMAVLNDASNADKHRLAPPAVAANALWKGDRETGGISRYYSPHEVPHATPGRVTESMPTSIPVPTGLVDCSWSGFGFLTDTTADIYYVSLLEIGLRPDVRLNAPLVPTVNFGDPERSFDAERLRVVSSFVRRLVLKVAGA